MQQEKADAEKFLQSYIKDFQPVSWQLRDEADASRRATLQELQAAYEQQIVSLNQQIGMTKHTKAVDNTNAVVYKDDNGFEDEDNDDLAYGK